MANKLTTSSQHITSLGFDLNKAKADLESLERMYNQTMRNIQAQATIGFSSGKRMPRSPIGQMADEMREMSVLESQFRRRIGWFFSGTLFYGSLSGAKQAVEAMRDVETSIMKIGRVMEDVTFQSDAFRDELLDVASEFGQDFDIAADVALRFAQAGYNMNDTLELTRTSLLAVNSAELDVKNSTESMIGIMAQWNLTAAEMPLVLDKINKVGDDFTVTSQDLVDGLLRSSQAARVMGMSLDETIATLTTMREASGRTGREVGNALNSILSYIQRPVAVNTLESMGISMFADEAKTQFRNFQDILADIAKQWPQNSERIKQGFIEAADGIENMSEELKTALGIQEEWTDLQKRDIAQSAAGVYRRNYFISLVSRQARIQDVLNSMMEAEGYSIQENARYMATLEAQIKTFNNEVLRLAVTMGDSGVLDFTKDLVYLGTEGAEALNSLVENLGTLPPALATVMASLSLFHRQMQIFRTDVSVAQTRGVFSAIGVNDVNRLTRAVREINDIYRVQMSLARMEGITSPTHWQKATTSVMAFSRALNLAGVSARALGFALNMAINIAAGLAIGLVIQKIYGLVAAQARAAEEAKATAQEMRNQQQAIEELQARYVELTKVSKNDEEAKRELIRTERQLKEILGESGKAIDLQNKSLEENVNLINKATKAKLESYRIARQEAYEQASAFLSQTGVSSISTGIDGMLLDFAGTPEQRLERMKDAWQRYDAVVQDSNHTNREAILIRNALSESIADLEEKISKARTEVKNYTDNEVELVKVLKEQADATRDSANAFSQYTALTDKEYESVKALQGELDTLSNAYRTLADGQELSASQMLDLIRNYDEIAEYVLKTNDLSLDSGKIAEQVFEVKKTALEQELKVLRANVTSKIEEYERERDKAFEVYRDMAGAKFMYYGLDIAMREGGGFAAAQAELNNLNAQIAAISRISIGDWSSSSSKGSSAAQERYSREQAALDEVNALLDRNAILRKHAEGDHWITLAEERIKLYGREKAAINTLIEAKRKELATTEKGTQEYYDLRKSIEKLYNDWLDAENKIIDVQKEITDRYKDLMQERMNAAEKAKDNSLQNIRDEYDAFIEAEEAKLRKLDRSEESRERQRYLEDYEKKRKELLEQRQYHEIRTGEEHRLAIIDIDKQIADLEVELNRKKEDWKTEKERESIQRRIDRYEAERDEKLKIIEETWERAQEMLEGANLKMLEETGAFTKELFSLYDNNFFKPLIEAFTGLDIDSLMPSLPSMPSPGRSSSGSSGGSSGPSSGGSSGGKLIEPSSGMDRDTYEKIRDTFHEQEKEYFDDFFNYPSAHTGAMTLREGLVNLAPNELIIRSDLTRALENFLKPYSGLGVPVSTDNSRRVTVDKAVNIEQAYFYDDVDVSSFGRETARQILVVGGSR